MSRTCNDVNALIVLGIVPESEFLPKRSFSNGLRPLIVLGIVPDSEFLPKSSIRNDVSPLIVIGIVPAIVLAYNDIRVILPKLPIEDGNVPLKDKEDNTIDCTLP